jgi:hypothetical protein
MTGINIGAKLLLKQWNYILKAERTTIAGIEEIKENISLKVCNDTEENKYGIWRQNGYEC